MFKVLVGIVLVFCVVATVRGWFHVTPVDRHIAEDFRTAETFIKERCK